MVLWQQFSWFLHTYNYWPLWIYHNQWLCVALHLRVAHWLLGQATEQTR